MKDSLYLSLIVVLVLLFFNKENIDLYLKNKYREVDTVYIRNVDTIRIIKVDTVYKDETPKLLRRINYRTYYIYKKIKEEENSEDIK